MREIKFRGYTTEGEKPRWIEGCGVEKIKYLGTNEEYFVVLHTQTVDDYVVNEESIGQYTGINDINGKEIYEGDIVEKEIMEPFEESKFIGVVQMIEGCWCVVNDKKLLAKNLWDETDVNSVIGNIYDNPKLLEE